jgi:hypothetical protein
VASPEWRDLFGDVTLYHLVSSRSDHCPLFLEVRKESWERHKSRIFWYYEIMWEQLESLLWKSRTPGVLMLAEKGWVV